MPALTIPASASMATPPVQTMPVAQFIATFPPMYYAGTWEDIKADAEAGHEPQGEYDDHFLASGTSGMDFDDLVCSVHDGGVQTPVDVVGGEVEDGHHRVVAAMLTGQPVPYLVWS